MVACSNIRNFTSPRPTTRTCDFGSRMSTGMPACVPSERTEGGLVAAAATWEHATLEWRLTKAYRWLTPPSPLRSPRPPYPGRRRRRSRNATPYVRAGSGLTRRRVRTRGVGAPCNVSFPSSPPTDPPLSVSLPPLPSLLGEIIRTISRAIRGLARSVMP